MIRHVVLALSLVLLSGCGWWNNFLGGTDNTEPPTPLAPLTNEVSVQSAWRAQSGADSGKADVRIAPSLNANNLHVAGFNGRVAALDQQTGAVRWRADVDAPISGGVGGGDDLVLVASTTGGIVALAPETGGERWRTSISRAVLSAPQAGFGVVVVHAVDGTLHGLSAADGSNLWTYSSTQPALTLRGTSAPLLVQSAAISGLDSGKVVVLDAASGRVFWERTVMPPSGRSELDRLVDIDGTPILMGKVLFVVTYQGRVAAMDVESGRVIWSREMSAYTGLDVDNFGVYATATDGTVWALDQRGGGAMWSQEALRYRRVTGPRVIGDYVVVGDFEGYLHWLAREDGRLVARVRPGNSAIVAAPTSNGSLLFALAQDGTVTAYRAP